MNETSEAASRGREDISQFIVHLTRDDRQTFPKGGATARENFIAIAKSRIIGTYKHHSLFNKRLEKLDKEVAKKVKRALRVACFTEVPLNQLHRLVGEMPGRQFALEPYGFVFKKKFIVAEGGQPAIYLNSYGGNTWIREAADELFDTCVNKEGDLQQPLSRILPFLNAMHEKYDFTWEREWRLVSDLHFGSSDVVCVILPPQGDEDLKEKFAAKGRAVISPGWSYEQIVSELARQQTATREYIEEKLDSKTAEKSE